MKRLLPIAFIVAALSVGAQEPPLMEAIVPGKAMLFMKTIEVAKFTVTVKLFMDKLLPEKQRQKAAKVLAGIKKAGGIDLLDAASLRAAGIDVDRGAGLAYFGGEGKDERIALLFPSRENKDITKIVVELLKKIATEKDPDVYPAVTEYRGSRISQVRSDIFMTDVAGFFVVASKGEIVREIIDTAAEGKGALSQDKDYLAYAGSGLGVYDVNAYATPAMVQEMQKRNRKEKSDEGKGAEGKTDTEPVNWVDYAFVGLSLKNNKLDAGFSLKSNGTDPQVTAALSSLKPGKAVRALDYKNALVYSMFTVWPEKLEAAYADKSALGAVYKAIKKSMEDTWGINYAKEFLPHMDGTVVIIGDKGGGLQGSLANFYSLRTKKSGEIILNKIVSRLKEGEKDGRFGQTKGKSGVIYWVLDKKNEKTFLAADERGFYYGNEQQILERAMLSDLVGQGKMLPGIPGTAVDDLFAAMYFSKKSPLRTIVALFAAAKSSELGVFSMLSRLGDISFTGRMKGPLVIMNVSADLEEGGQ